ncbi:MAG: ribonuclease P protein component [Spirochaetaceae bacterium]|nr:ribonuclease P protein component [Spirochaetaceae bacterium]
MGDARFTRDERIKKSGEIKLLFKKGSPVSIGGAKLFVSGNGTGGNRVAFTLPRHFGTAVQRNRVKRLCREAYRLRKNTLRSGHDLLFLMYSGPDSFGFRDGQLRRLCKKAGLLRISG